MIKTFKDFDKELNSQRIYEDFIVENNSNINFDNYNSFIPELVSDDDKLLHISNIILKRLSRVNIDKIILNPAVVVINGVKGVHFYNYDDPSINIIVCRDNYSNKYAYYIKREILSDIHNGKKSFTADLVISTKEAGFGDLIDKLLSYLKTDNKIIESFSFINEVKVAPKYKMCVKGCTNYVTPVYVEKFKDIDINALCLIYTEYAEALNNGDTQFSKYMSILVNNQNLMGEFQQKGIEAEKVAQIFTYMMGIVPLLPNKSNNVDLFKDDVNPTFQKILDTINKTNPTNPNAQGNAANAQGNAANAQGNAANAQGGAGGTQEEDENAQGGAGANPFAIVKNKNSQITFGGNNDAKIEKEIEKYNDDMDEIGNIAEELCKFVKKRGKLADIYKIIDYNTTEPTEEQQKEIDKLLSEYPDPSVLSGQRCLFVSGTAGSGKTHSIETALKKHNMVENVDFYRVKNSQSQADDIYATLYRYNGKLIIFDDSPGIFGGEGKQAIWKAALSNLEKQQNQINSPRVSEIKHDEYTLRSKGLYSPLKNDGGSKVDITRQERYILETGNSTRSEKEKFKKERYAELRDKFITAYTKKEGTEPSGKKIDAESASSDWDGLIEKEWKDSRKPLMPTSFYFTGAVIFITNNEEEDLEEKMGHDHWMAIYRRSKTFFIKSPSEAIWARAKNAILNEMNNTSLKNQNRMIPKEVSKAFISVVENIFKYSTDDVYADFSTFSERMHNVFKTVIYTNIEKWSKELAKAMGVTWNKKFIENITI